MQAFNRNKAQYPPSYALSNLPSDLSYYCLLPARWHCHLFCVFVFLLIGVNNRAAVQKKGEEEAKPQINTSSSAAATTAASALWLAEPQLSCQVLHLRQLRDSSARAQSEAWPRTRHLYALISVCRVCVSKGWMPCKMHLLRLWPHNELHSALILLLLLLLLWLCLWLLCWQRLWWSEQDSSIEYYMSMYIQ